LYGSELKTGVGVRVASGTAVGEMSDDGAGVGVESVETAAVEHAVSSAPTQRRINIRFRIRPYYSLKRGEGEIRDCDITVVMNCMQCFHRKPNALRNCQINLAKIEELLAHREIQLALLTVA
jgi:hypothetical protein